MDWHQITSFAMTHWVLVVSFVAIALLIIAEEGKSRGVGGGQVNPKMAVAMINRDQAVVVDIRSKDAYKAGHIVGAISIPKDDIEDSPKIKSIEGNPLVIVSAKGHDANRVALTLRRKGFDTKVLAGGIDAWKAADMPVMKKK